MVFHAIKSEWTNQPTNQPINTYNTQFILMDQWPHTRETNGIYWQLNNILNIYFVICWFGKMDWKIGKVKFYQHQKQNASSNKSETKNSKTSWSLKKKKTNKQEQQIFEWHKKTYSIIMCMKTPPVGIIYFKMTLKTQCSAAQQRCRANEWNGWRQWRWRRWQCAGNDKCVLYRFFIAWMKAKSYNT